MPSLIHPIGNRPRRIAEIWALGRGDLLRARGGAAGAMSLGGPKTAKLGTLSRKAERTAPRERYRSGPLPTKPIGGMNTSGEPDALSLGILPMIVLRLSRTLTSD